MKRLDEALKKLQEDLLKEDRRPSAGIWYIIWLKPNWVLRTYSENDFPNVDHFTIWDRALHIEVADYYKINEKKIQNLTYAFPRGRVVYRNKRGRPVSVSMTSDMTGKWFLYHGNDSPGGISKWKKKLITEFNLGGFLGNITWNYEEHECMQREDVHQMSSIIGDYI